MGKVTISGLYQKDTDPELEWDETNGALLLSNGSFAIDKSSDYGIKIDTDAPDFGYRDITGEVRTRGIGATDPAWTQVGATPFYAYAFAVNDVCWIDFHIPHDYTIGTDIYIHTHWFPSGTNTNSVKWQYEYAYAKGHNQGAFNFATATTVTAEQSPPGTAYQHMVTETVAQTVTGMEPDGILAVKMTRITNGATDNADTIFVQTLDVHYQSTNLATKNRSPSFYT